MTLIGLGGGRRGGRLLIPLRLRLRAGSFDSFALLSPSEHALHPIAPTPGAAGAPAMQRGISRELRSLFAVL